MFEDVKLQIRLVNFFCIILFIIMILNIIFSEEKNTKKPEVNCCFECECVKNGK